MGEYIPTTRERQYREARLALQQAQARVAQLEDALRGIILYLDDSPKQTVVPDGRINDAKDAMAEGEQR